MKNYENYYESQRNEATGKPRKICQGCDETKFYRWVLVFKGAIDSRNGKNKIKMSISKKFVSFFKQYAVLVMRPRNVIR